MLRVAIVGCGKIADAHVEQIRATGRGEVVAICDHEPLMLEQLAVRLGITGQFTDYAEMLAGAQPDVVHIATPPESHLALACAALDAGCHVFVEKPFALRSEEATFIIDCAKRADKKAGVNYLYNFETPGLRLEQLLMQGALGEIVHLDTHYGYNLAGDYGLAVMADPNHWVHRLPGKLFHNVLDHVLAKVVAHLGDDTTVQVTALRRRDATGNPIIDAIKDELRFIIRSERVTVTGMVSAHGRPVAHSLRVVGSKDTVELDYGTRTLVHAARWTQPSALGRLFPPWMQARQFAKNGWQNLNLFARYKFHYFECMRVLLNRFYDAVENKGPEPIPADQILRVCRLIDQIVQGMGNDP